MEGDVMPGYGIYKVIGTKAESHPEGTLVIGWCGWTRILDGLFRHRLRVKLPECRAAEDTRGL